MRHNPSCPHYRDANSVAHDAVVDANGRWIFAVEHEEWNEGALLFAGLNPSTLDDFNSRASIMLESVNKAFQDAALGGYRTSGQYIDSTMGFDGAFCGYIDFRRSSLATTEHPLSSMEEAALACCWRKARFPF